MGQTLLTASLAEESGPETAETVTKGDVHSLINIFFTFAGFWVMGRTAKQHKEDIYEMQRLKKELKKCRARRNKHG
jgi:hypothetical protein